MTLEKQRQEIIKEGLASIDLCYQCLPHIGFSRYPALSPNSNENHQIEKENETENNSTPSASLLPVDPGIFTRCFFRSFSLPQRKQNGFLFQDLIPTPRTSEPLSVETFHSGVVPLLPSPQGTWLHTFSRPSPPSPWLLPQTFKEHRALLPCFLPSGPGPAACKCLFVCF